jgi:hypothetical protein
MQPLAKLLLDGSQRRAQPLGDGIASDREPAVTFRLVAKMREAEKVERLGATLAALLSAFDRETTELD